MTGLGDAYEVTRATYALRAFEYARATLGYEDFPGLKEVVDTFGDSCDPAFPVLDAGCGCGRDSAALSRKGLRVVGLDRSPEMLAFCDPTPSGTARLCGDFLCLPCADSSFGGYLAVASLIHVLPQDLVVAAREARRVLVSGGLFTATLRRSQQPGVRKTGLVEGDRYVNDGRPEPWLAVLSAVGFVTPGYTDSGPGGWVALTARAGAKTTR